MCVSKLRNICNCVKEERLDSLRGNAGQQFWYGWQQTYRSEIGGRGWRPTWLGDKHNKSLMPVSRHCQQSRSESLLKVTMQNLYYYYNLRPCYLEGCRHLTTRERFSGWKDSALLSLSPPQRCLRSPAGQSGKTGGSSLEKTLLKYALIASNSEALPWSLPSWVLM